MDNLYLSTHVTGSSSTSNCPENSVIPDSTHTRLLNSAQQALKISAGTDRFWPSYWDEMNSFILTEPHETILLVTENSQPENSPFKAVCGSKLPNSLVNKTYILKGTLPDLSASRGRFDLNYKVGNDTLTAVSLQETVPQTIEFLFHEAFHSFQRRMFPPRYQSEKLLSEIYTSNEYQIYEPVERNLLIAALESSEGENITELLRAYITIRNKRVQHISADAINAERELERTEGVAQAVSEYAGILFNSSEKEEALIKRIQELLSSDYKNALSDQWRYRSRLYGTGAALVLLLDKYTINWQQELIRGAFLDEILVDQLKLEPIQDSKMLNKIIESHQR